MGTRRCNSHVEEASFNLSRLNLKLASCAIKYFDLIGQPLVLALIGGFCLRSFLCPVPSSHTYQIRPLLNECVQTLSKLIPRCGYHVCGGSFRMHQKL